MDQKSLTSTIAEQLETQVADCGNIDQKHASATITETGGFMSATPYSPTRQPVLPSSGGLMGRSFTYRTAEKTDVRLTWERAKAGLSKPKAQA
jgi:hypothetical protein